MIPTQLYRQPSLGFPVRYVVYRDKRSRSTDLKHKINRSICRDDKMSRSTELKYTLSRSTDRKSQISRPSGREVKRNRSTDCEVRRPLFVGVGCRADVEAFVEVRVEDEMRRGRRSGDAAGGRTAGSGQQDAEVLEDADADVSLPTPR